MVLLSAQISQQGRRIMYRLTGYSAWLRDSL